MIMLKDLEKFYKSVSMRESNLQLHRKLNINSVRKIRQVTQTHTKHQKCRYLSLILYFPQKKIRHFWYYCLNINLDYNPYQSHSLRTANWKWIIKFCFWQKQYVKILAYFGRSWIFRTELMFSCPIIEQLRFFSFFLSTVCSFKYLCS